MTVGWLREFMVDIYAVRDGGLLFPFFLWLGSCFVYFLTQAEFHCLFRAEHLSQSSPSREVAAGHVIILAPLPLQVQSAFFLQEIISIFPTSHTMPPYYIPPPLPPPQGSPRNNAHLSTTSKNSPHTMPPYYATSLPPPLPPQPGPPQNNTRLTNPWTPQPNWAHHPPYHYPTSISPPHSAQIYMGKGSSSQPMLDLDARPVHQGGMSTYDKPGLAKWVAANSRVMAHAHQPAPPVPSKAATHDHHQLPRYVPTVTTQHNNSTAVATPEPRFCPKKVVRFTPSVQARDEEEHEAKDKVRSNGERNKRLACERCHVRSVDWTVDGEDICDGCYRDSGKRRYGGSIEEGRPE